MITSPVNYLAIKFQSIGIYINQGFFLMRKIYFFQRNYILFLQMYSLIIYPCCFLFLTKIC